MRPARRPRILLFAAYYWPGYKAGGPIRSATNFVAAFSRSHDIHVVTQDRDARETLAYAEVRASRWVEVRGAKVWYLPPGASRAWTMWRLIREVDPDIIILNSFFSPAFSLLPRLLMAALPADSRAIWLLHPRGELAPSALAIKPLRKRLVLWLSALLGERALRFHVSSGHEAADLSRALAPSSDRVHVAMNLADATVGEPPIVPPPIAGTPLRFVFLSRISPVKNLELALRSVFRVPRPCILDIYGPVSDSGYARRCEQVAAGAPAHVSVNWRGQVPHDQVRQVLSQYHYLVFPTEGENFGHVIIEALASGIPAIISDRTPWRDLEGLGAGWVRSLDTPGDFEAAVLAASRLDARAWSAMSERARSRARAFVHSDSALPANESMLARLLGEALS